MVERTRFLGSWFRLLGACFLSRCKHFRFSFRSWKFLQCIFYFFVIIKIHLLCYLSINLWLSINVSPKFNKLMLLECNVYSLGINICWSWGRIGQQNDGPKGKSKTQNLEFLSKTPAIFGDTAHLWRKSNIIYEWLFNFGLSPDLLAKFHDWDFI